MIFYIIPMGITDKLDPKTANIYFNNNLILQGSSSSTVLNLPSLSISEPEDKIYFVINRDETDVRTTDVLTFATDSLTTTGTFDATLYIEGSVLTINSGAPSNNGKTATIATYTATVLTLIDSTFVSETVDTTVSNVSIGIITCIDSNNEISDLPVIPPASIPLFPTYVATQSDISTAIGGGFCNLVLIQDLTLTADIDLAGADLTFVVPCNITLDMATFSFVNTGSNSRLSLKGGGNITFGSADLADAAAIDKLYINKLNITKTGTVVLAPATTEQMIHDVSFSVGGSNLIISSNIATRLTNLEITLTATDITMLFNITETAVISDINITGSSTGTASLLSFDTDDVNITNLQIDSAVSGGADIGVIGNGAHFTNCKLGGMPILLNDYINVGFTNCSDFSIKEISSITTTVDSILTMVNCALNTFVLTSQYNNIRCIDSTITTLDFGATGASVDVRYSSFTNCTIGTISQSDTVVALINLTFRNCTIGVFGLASLSATTISNLRFIGCDISSSIAITFGSDVDHLVFRDNTLSDSLTLLGSSAAITHSFNYLNIIENRIGGNLNLGGAIFNNPRINNNVLSGTAPANGSINFTSDGFQLFNAIIDGNNANSKIYFNVNNPGAVLSSISSCKLINNLIAESIELDTVGAAASPYQIQDVLIKNNTIGISLLLDPSHNVDFNSVNICNNKIGNDTTAASLLSFDTFGGELLNISINGNSLTCNVIVSSNISIKGLIMLNNTTSLATTAGFGYSITSGTVDDILIDGNNDENGGSTITITSSLNDNYVIKNNTYNDGVVNLLLNTVPVTRLLFTNNCMGKSPSGGSTIVPPNAVNNGDILVSNNEGVFTNIVQGGGVGQFTVVKPSGTTINNL